MAVSVLAIYIAVVVDEVFVACVVGRVDVDNIDFAGVGVGQRGECFEVVALDKDVVRRIVSAIGEGLRLVLDEHRQLVAQPFLHVFLFVLPHQAVSLLGAQQFQQVAALIVGEFFERFDSLYQFGFGFSVH